jgi:hypothetical protein
VLTVRLEAMVALPGQRWTSAAKAGKYPPCGAKTEPDQSLKGTWATCEACYRCGQAPPSVVWAWRDGVASW